tara:strand:- start:49 stop:930 length:882 start_codon:yes stop_codon:yes gene_type:complete
MSISVELSGITNDKWDSEWYVNTNEAKDYGANTGLGNFLFQISSCLALAWDNNQELYCHHINIWCDNEKVNKKESIWKNVKIDKIITNKTINVRHGYHKNIFKYNPNTKYNGYMQCYKYFDHYREKLQNFFGPNDDNLKYIYSKYKDYLEKKTCSLHVRKGKDYETIAQKWNPEFILKKGYYDKAINFIKDKVELFLVFSDNMPYCKKLFTNEKYPNINFVFISERDYIDIWIMSLCNHHITSNSTFSWWGAYLNKSKLKKVIAPNKSIFLEKKNKKTLIKTYYFDDWILFDE